LFGWRYGQTYFNILAQDNLEVANLIRATDLDPFAFEQLTELQHQRIEGIWNGLLNISQIFYKFRSWDKSLYRFT
jgi:hypothetical protein